MHHATSRKETICRHEKKYRFHPVTAGADRGAIRVRALASDPQTDNAAAVFLVAGVDGVGQLATVPLALDIKLASGWHTYWRSPGEAGLPPVVDWSKSLTDDNNLKSATLLYPAPKRYTAFGLETIGYRDHILLPIDAELRTPGKPLNIDANLDLLVCSQICVPKHYILKLTVPAGDARESAEAPLIKQFRDQIPGDAEKSGLNITNVTSDGQSLAVSVTAREPLDAPDIFVEDAKDINFGAPTVNLTPDRKSAQLTVKPTIPLPEGTSLAGMSFDFTVIDGNRALQQSETVPVLTTPSTVAPSSASRRPIRHAGAGTGNACPAARPCDCIRHCRRLYSEFNALRAAGPVAEDAERHQPRRRRCETGAA